MAMKKFIHFSVIIQLLILFPSIFIHVHSQSKEEYDCHEDDWTYLPTDIEIEQTIKSTYVLIRGCVSSQLVFIIFSSNIVYCFFKKKKRKTLQLVG